MTMPALQCRRCQALLPAYIHRELSPRARRWVAAHLSRCDVCSRVYVDHREVARSLAAEMPAVGRGFDRERGWASVQARLLQPSPPHKKRFHKRWGAAALLLAAALILPSLSVNAPRAFALHARPPLQQTPPVGLESADTPALGAPAVRVSATPAAKIETPSAKAITPPAQPNYAPSWSAQAAHTPCGL
jgi:anti-sigma factor RsiW